MPEQKRGGVARALQPYVCGGASAMFASTCIHPIDLTKVRLQLIGEGTRNAPRPSAVSVMRIVAQTEGVSALYAGLTASLTRQATYGTARIGLHTAFSARLRERNGGNAIPLAQKFLSSFASGAIASMIGNPFDVSLVRMQSDGLKPAAERRGYTNVFDAVHRIVREEGFMSLYHGYPPTLLRAIAMNVGMMMTYDQIKETVTKINGPTFSTQLISSAGAGFACAWLSLPFDMMKTRLQNMKVDPITRQMPYSGLGDCFLKILRQEGVLAFWNGFGAFYSRCAPHAMIILLIRERLTRLYGEALCGD
jgi:solute carrier family 25 oxoglutarate transporter 11